MKINFKTRPWVYLFLWPIIGYFCMALPLSFDDFQNNSSLYQLSNALFLYIFIPFVVFAIFALITEFITRLISKILPDYVNKTAVRVVIAIGIITFTAKTNADVATVFFVITVLYMVCILPALISGFTTNLISKILPNYFKKTAIKLFIPALIGTLVTTSLFITFLYLEKEMNEISWAMPIGLCAALASVACEIIYLKLINSQPSHRPNEEH